MSSIDLPALERVDKYVPKPDQLSTEHKALRYATSLTLSDSRNAFVVATENVPDIDLTMVEKVTGELLAGEKRKEIKYLLVNNRFQNRICDSCLKKTHIYHLLLCTKCCLTWYCNEQCQRKHAAKHEGQDGRAGPLKSARHAAFRTAPMPLSRRVPCP